MKRLILTFLFVFSAVASSMEANVVDILCRLKARSEESRTDSLLVIRNYKTVFEYHTSAEFPRLECHEMARPLFALAIGFLKDERYITSLDTLVSTFCPEYECGSWSGVTIRSLLAAEDDSFEGLGAVVKAISGEEWHDYLQIKLLTPLGISPCCWRRDSCGRMKLCLTAPELAKVGLLVTRCGELKGKQLLSRAWIQSLQTPTTHTDPFMGMQWFLEYYDFSTYWDDKLLELYSCKGISGGLVAMLRRLNGRVVHFGGLAIRGHLIHGWGRDIFCALGGQSGLSGLISETYRHRVPLGYFNGGGIKSIIAWGRGGQQLIVIPDKKVVAVRQTSHLTGCDDFEDLIEVIDDYIKAVDCYID